MRFANGRHVTVKAEMRLSKVIDGILCPGEMLGVGPRSVGRVLNVFREVPRLVYLVKFGCGDLRIPAKELVPLTDSTVEISRAAMKVADPDLQIDKRPPENEPGYE